VSFRLFYNKILISTTVIIECIRWLINVTGNEFVNYVQCYINSLVDLSH
jgi:hypothetical protein